MVVDKQLSVKQHLSHMNTFELYHILITTNKEFIPIIRPEKILFFPVPLVARPTHN